MRRQPISSPVTCESIESPMTKKWKTYEEVATYLLNEFAAKFGLEKVEGKQAVNGHRSKTKWTIDAKGVKQGDEGFLIVECRRYTTSKQNQGKLAELAYRIMDTQADGGIIVSPLGVQKGAAKIAAAENIIEVQLNEDSTTNEYILRFLDNIMVGCAGELTFSGSVKAVLIKNPENQRDNR